MSSFARNKDAFNSGKRRKLSDSSFKASCPEVDWKKHKEYKKKRREEKLLKQLKNKEEATISEQIESGKSSSCRGRQYTVSIALPGSILDNAQSPELQTYLVGQVARAAAIFNVDEIIVFDETGSSIIKKNEDDEYVSIGESGKSSVRMARILQYLECPQYLRKQIFPLHKDLSYAGLLNPLDTHHHMRSTDVSYEYREGIVAPKPVKEGKNGSYVYIGLNKNAYVDTPLQAGTRVTVKLDNNAEGTKHHYKGTVVSPHAPRLEAGLYWGYNVRVAASLGSVFTECPFRGGYDVTIGTSDKGKSVDEFHLSSFNHLLIVFGGLRGLEACLEADKAFSEVEKPDYLFHHYLNTCPYQGSKTIRTEEAILITLAALRPKIVTACSTELMYLLPDCILEEENMEKS